MIKRAYETTKGVIASSETLIEVLTSEFKKKAEIKKLKDSRKKEMGTVKRTTAVTILHYETYGVRAHINKLVIPNFKCFYSFESSDKGLYLRVGTHDDKKLFIERRYKQERFTATPPKIATNFNVEDLALATQIRRMKKRAEIIAKNISTLSFNEIDEDAEDVVEDYGTVPSMDAPQIQKATMSCIDTIRRP